MKVFTKENKEVIYPEKVHETLSDLCQTYIHGSTTNEHLADILLYTIEWATGGVVKSVDSFDANISKFIEENFRASDD